MLNTFLFKRICKELEQIQYGQLTLSTPDGQQYHFEGLYRGSKADIQIHDWRLFGLVAAKADVGFTDAYRLGYCDTSDLAVLLQFFLENSDNLQGSMYGNSVSQFFFRFAYYFKENTLKGSRRNIYAHYDLGNDFYKLWLDPSMTYSSAIFDTNDDLKHGQFRKYQRILDQFDASSGSLLEVGCGWGGFAEHALAHDFDFTGITLSPSQLEYSKQRLKNRGQFKLEDYRHQKGSYDYLVSIEMFEAVGEKYWKTYFDKVASLLNKGGQAMIQTITIDDRHFEQYRRSGDVFRSYIFPGGMLPSVPRIEKLVQNSGLQVENQYAFGLDYAKTCEIWLDNFNAKLDEVRALNFDDGFIRLWQFYLSACIAGFKHGRCNVVQMHLSH